MDCQIPPMEWAFAPMAVVGLLIIPLGLGMSTLHLVGQLAFLLYDNLSFL